MYKNVILIGAGGHAKVIADIVVKQGDTLLGFLDDNKTVENAVGFPVLGKLDDMGKYCDSAEFIVAIGDNCTRRTIAEKFDFTWYTAIHPSAQIGLDVKIGNGTVIMANAVINSSTQIGKHCIINTGAVVEHDNCLSDYSHISPGVILCGNVCVGENTHIGAGTTVKNVINICANVIVGAGTVVVRNISEGGTYFGVPARRV